MCFYVIQALVQASEHIREFRPSNGTPSPWSIKSFGRGIQKVIILQVLFNLGRKLQVASLSRQKALTLLLEIGRLRFDCFERFGQATQEVEGRRGIG